jgi:hypothetical protein
MAPTTIIAAITTAHPTSPATTARPIFMMTL